MKKNNPQEEFSIKWSIEEDSKAQQFRKEMSWKRHLMKTISYRILSSGLGFAIVSITTGNIKIGAAFSLAEMVYKPFVYFLHERFWYKYVKYGIKTPK